MIAFNYQESDRIKWPYMLAVLGQLYIYSTSPFWPLPTPTVFICTEIVKADSSKLQRRLHLHIENTSCREINYTPSPFQIDVMYGWSWKQTKCPTFAAAPPCCLISLIARSRTCSAASTPSRGGPVSSSSRLAKVSIRSQSYSYQSPGMQSILVCIHPTTPWWLHLC